MPPGALRKSRSRAVFSGGATVAAATACAFFMQGCQPPRAMPTRPATLAAKSPPRAANATDANALDWWKRTLDAPRTIPVRASVVVTRFYADNKPPAISRYELLEALGGRKYRITYHAPASAAGRIVLCDGQTLWQYEPNHDTVLRRPVAPPSGTFPSQNEADEASKSGETGPMASDLIPAARLVRLEPEADSVAGRPTRVLARIGTAPAGAVVERRWVDSQTGRTLRTEQYDTQGKKRRRVEMTQVEFSPKIEEGEFMPHLAEGVRIVDTTQKNPLPQSGRRETEAAARRVHLPLRAHGFTLRSASTTQTPPVPRSMEAAPAVNAATPPAVTNTTHLVYSDGMATLSVFVTPAAAGSSDTNASDTSLVLNGAAGWKAVLLKGAKPNQKVWMQETPTRTAIAWTRNHNRLVAVAQMPLRELIPLVETMTDKE